MSDILSELITYHQKKRDWFQYNKELRQFHETVLKFLDQLSVHDRETGEVR